MQSTLNRFVLKYRLGTLFILCAINFTVGAMQAPGPGTSTVPVASGTYPGANAGPAVAKGSQISLPFHGVTSYPTDRVFDTDSNQFNWANLKRLARQERDNDLSEVGHIAARLRNARRRLDLLKKHLKGVTSFGYWANNVGDFLDIFAEQLPDDQKLEYWTEIALAPKFVTSFDVELTADSAGHSQRDAFEENASQTAIERLAQLGSHDAFMVLALMVKRGEPNEILARLSLRAEQLINNSRYYVIDRTTGEAMSGTNRARRDRGCASLATAKKGLFDF